VIEIKHIVSFSGGKDSTAMLLMMIEKDMQIDEIVFCDTGMEFPAMYEHIDEVERCIGSKITRLKAEHSFEFMMFDYVKKKGKHKGKKGYGWPDFRNRWCTSYLKRDLLGKYLQGINAIEYHGIALDEAHRAEKNKERSIKYPLIEWKITEKDALNYCYSKGFNWGGLYDRFHRVSCWHCPLQSIPELKQLYTHFPALWQRLKRMDKKAWNQFRADYTVQELEERFLCESRQLSFQDMMKNGLHQGYGKGLKKS